MTSKCTMGCATPAPSRGIPSFLWHLAAFPGARRVRGPATLGSDLIAARRLISIEGLLVLTLLGLRIDLDEHHQDDTGPQCPAERVEQVGQQQTEAPSSSRI